jgi:phage gpG-like protein
MSDVIDVQLSGDITAGLLRLVELGLDATPAMAEIAGLLETETQFRFQSETAPDGTKWKPSLRVTGYTFGGEKVPGDGGQTLTLHGYLRRSIRSNFGADFAEAGPEASGPAAIYARIHNEGGRITPRESVLQTALRTPFGYKAAVVIPKREYLGWNANMDAEALDIVRRHAATALEGEA